MTFIQFSSSSAGSNKGDNFTCVIIAIDVKAKVVGRLHKDLPNEQLVKDLLDEELVEDLHKEQRLEDLPNEEIVEDLPNEELPKDVQSEKHLENFHYIAKVMPANEYRASWLQEVGLHKYFL